MCKKFQLDIFWNGWVKDVGGVGQKKIPNNNNNNKKKKKKIQKVILRESYDFVEDSNKKMENLKKVTSRSRPTSSTTQKYEMLKLKKY